MFDVTQLIIPLVVASIILFLIIGGIPFAPWVPTMKADFARINTIARLKKGERFYELGCGDGRVSIALGIMNPEAYIIGIERSFLIYILAQILRFFSRAKNVRIVYANALTYDLSDADVVYVFGMADTMNSKLHKTLSRAKKPGLRLVSYVFPIHKWKDRECKSKPSDQDKSIYLYTF